MRCPEKRGTNVNDRKGRSHRRMWERRDNRHARALRHVIIMPRRMHDHERHRLWVRRKHRRRRAVAQNADLDVGGTGLLDSIEYGMDFRATLRRAERGGRDSVA